MKILGKILAPIGLFQGRIYLIISAVAFCCLYLNNSFCQETGAYRTIASGNFGNIAIWQIYDGLVWTPASSKPTSINDIYIDRTHKVTLTANEEVKSLFINAEMGAGEKLNLNGRNLNLYGSLNSFSGSAPGTPAGTWNSQNWIGNSINSTLTFKGNSRVIIPKDSWSGFSTQSRYSVIFDPGDGATLTIEEPIKAVRFIIRSGIVRQKLDISVIPNFCSSITFNTETSFNPGGAFGDFIIEANGKFISECNDNIISRSISGSVSAALFDLQTGGELILEGTSPRIEAASLQLNGKVTFNKNSGTQNFISKSYAGSTLPLIFHDLEIQGSQSITLPSTITVTGDMIKSGTGQFLTNTSHINFSGPDVQTISGFGLSPQDLTVNKSGGEVRLNQNLNVLRNLTMTNGKLNFQDNSLTINSSNVGSLNYQGGSWENLSSFTYANVPSTFNPTNGTFPFGDRYQGGIRKVQLLGTNVGGNLNINFTEYEGADFNPSFEDTGGIPILYRLFSYFTFSGLVSSSNPVELRISADKLIVDEPEDLRLVCTGYAAPGTHIENLDEDNLWAIRSLTFDDLPGKNFTVGSYRTLSILPVIWLSLSAKISNNIKKVNWSVAAENNNKIFEILRSENPPEDWTKVGEVESQGDSESPAIYSFIDDDYSKPLTTYYKIKVLNFFGQESISEVVKLENNPSPSNTQFSIWPNPHFSGKVRVVFPEDFTYENAEIRIYTAQGQFISSFSYNDIEFSENLEVLNPGLYLITFSNAENFLKTRWIKR